MDWFNVFYGDAGSEATARNQSYCMFCETRSVQCQQVEGDERRWIHLCAISKRGTVYNDSVIYLERFCVFFQVCAEGFHSFQRHGVVDAGTDATDATMTLQLHHFLCNGSFEEFSFASIRGLSVFNDAEWDVHPRAFLVSMSSAFLCIGASAKCISEAHRVNDVNIFNRQKQRGSRETSLNPGQRKTYR